MPHYSFYPGREGPQLDFFKTIQERAPGYYPVLEVTPARVIKLESSLEWLVWTWGTLVPSRRLDAPAAVAWRNLLASGTTPLGVTVAPPVPSTLTPPFTIPQYGALTWLF